MIRIFLTETYSIEDAYWFNSATTNSIENYFDISSGVTSQSIYGFNADGWKYGNASSYTRMPATFTLPSIPFEFSFDLTEAYRDSPNVGFLPNDGLWIERNRNSGTINIFGTDTGVAWDTGYRYTFKVYSDRVEVCKGNSLIGVLSKSITQVYLELTTGTNRYCRIKNIKLKIL